MCLLSVIWGQGTHQQITLTMALSSRGTSLMTEIPCSLSCNIHLKRNNVMLNISVLSFFDHLIHNIIFELIICYAVTLACGSYFASSRAFSKIWRWTARQNPKGVTIQIRDLNKYNFYKVLYSGWTNLITHPAISYKILKFWNNDLCFSILWSLTLNSEIPLLILLCSFWCTCACVRACVRACMRVCMCVCFEFEQDLYKLWFVHSFSYESWELPYT